MEEWGNGRANEYYEHNMPANVARPKDGDSVRMIEKFVRDKYEHKKYMAKIKPPIIKQDEQVREDDEGRRKVGSGSISRPRPTASDSTPFAKPVVVVPAVSLIDFLDFNNDPIASMAAPLVRSFTYFSYLGKTNV
jgi:hypothetical protein